MTERATVLVVWLPSVVTEGPLRVERMALLVAATSRTLLTVSQKRSDVQGAIAAALPASAAPFPTRLAYAVLRMVLERNQELATRLEQELRALEGVPVTYSAPDFFQHTFRLEKELSSARGDVWRLKGILAAMAEGRARIHGSRPEDAEFLRGLREEAEGLHETVGMLRENLVSVIDLHMNVASFEMNKVMRLLAVISMLGLIPAVVGGLFGMNLEGNPWPLTLSQVAFGVSMGMLLCLYVFFIKGWMR